MFVLAAVVVLPGRIVWGEDGAGDGKAAAARPATAMTAAVLEPGTGGAVVRAPGTAAQGPCELEELVAAPSRPVWTAGAATTQCGSLETDYR
jgi:hypothetical protein